MALLPNSDLRPVRLGAIEGCPGKKNDVIFHPPSCEKPEAHVIFFGGDVQDYKENMLKHRDNKYHAEWDLESTCSLLHRHFPSSIVLLIRPSKMGLMTFSCFANFVEVNNFGAPTYDKSIDSLKHLLALLSNIEDSLRALYQNKTGECNFSLDQDIPIKLIGFSKGSVVLNQFLYSFLALKDYPAEDLVQLTSRITDLYWLEGGHSGSAETWVTNKAVLENFAKMRKTVHIHVTPYQVFCDTRPRIGKEEKIFRESLYRLGTNIKRTLHFEDEPRCIENHFKILNVFE